MKEGKLDPTITMTYSQTLPKVLLCYLDISICVKPSMRSSCKIVDYIEWELNMNTVEHTYDACPNYSELRSFRIIAYLF